MRALLIAVLFTVTSADAASLRFDAAGDPIERASVFRIDLDLPVLARDGWTLGAGYGQRSFWTIENTGGNDRVETDFAPSVFVRRTKGPWTARTGYVHESNGRLNDASRSWNRILFALRRQTSWGSAEVVAWAAFRVEDTNPDLRRHVGDGAFVLATSDDRAWQAQLRTGFTFDPGDRGVFPNVRAQVLLDLPVAVFPGTHVRALVEARYGRGESLLRHEEITRALRVGVSIAL